MTLPRGPAVPTKAFWRRLTPSGDVQAERVLVIEGGGMRGAYANGVLTAFEKAGYHPWDAVVGTSAGGAMAAWYSAGQAEYAEGTWRYAQDPRILNYRRWVTRKGPLLDHDALFRIVYEREHPLDVRAVQEAPWPVLVTVVDVATGICQYVDLRDGDVIDWLRATGRLPFGSNGPVTIGGRRWLDGGVIDPVPVRYAVEALGAKHVTLLLNNPDRPRRPDPRWVLELAGRRYPALRDGIVHHQGIKSVSYGYADDPPDGARIDVVRPTQPTGLRRMSRDLEKIQAAIRQGHKDGRGYLQRQAPN